MPKEYQPKKNNPYWIGDKDLYLQTRSFIKRYPKLKREYQDILHGSPPPPDGMPRGNQTGDPTAAAAERLALCRVEIDAIEGVMAHMREKYRQTYTGEPFPAYEAFMDYGVFCYYRSKKGGKGLAPDRRTWSRYRSEFVWMTAQKMGWI